jgi:hypothetical protein
MRWSLPLLNVEKPLKLVYRRNLEKLGGGH